MEFAQKRWIALIAAMVCAFFSGVIYTWSVYVIPLANKYHWSTAEISFAYTLNIIFSAIIPIVFAKLRTKIKISNYNFIGACVYGAGMLYLSIMWGSIWELYLGFGVLVGGGIGFIYVSLVAYVVQLFPDKKGLAAGLYTAAYGAAALIWAPLANSIIQSTGDVSMAFRYLGITMTAVMLVGTRFLFDIPSDWTGPSVSTAQSSRNNGKPTPGPVSEKSTREMFVSPLFYVTWVMFILGLISGSMILALGSPILQGSLGWTETRAALVVGFFAVAQTVGRLFWGWISDLIGRINVITIVGASTVLAMFLLAYVRTETLYVIAILCVPMAYGAYASMLSPITAETFGPKYFPNNYNAIFTAFAFAALIGPQLVAYVKKTSGGYQGAFLYAIMFAAIAILLSFAYRYLADKERARVGTKEEA